MKKTLAIVLALVLVLGGFGNAFAATAPNDVAGLPCEAAVNALTEAGVIDGYADGTFRPNAAITRAEVTKLIMEALGYGGEVSQSVSNFSDTQNHWANNYITIGQQLGIISGYPDGTFRPDSTITYYEIVTILMRTLGYTNVDGIWPNNYVAAAEPLGIIGDVAITGADANRGDVAILIYQAWEKPIGTIINGVWTANEGPDTLKARAMPKPAISSTSGRRSSGGSSGDDGELKGMDLKDIVDIVSTSVDGETAFDYVSYVYLGWRTTGGPWQNHVIEEYLVQQFVNAGYTFSENDMSTANDEDYVWVQHDDSVSLVWAPQFASLEVTSEGDGELVDTFNVTAYGFDPTSDIYMDYYGEQYGVETIEDMYEWITVKEADGSRTNVANGLEAELNKRAHLATNSCFTDPVDTPVDEATGVEGEVVYIGSVKSEKVDEKTIYYGTETGIEGNKDLKGKVLLSDSSNRTTFNLAKQVGAVAIMTTYALDDYNNPVIDGEMWYTNSARYAGGAAAADSLNQMEAKAPIVQWNLSLDQEAAMHTLLADAKETKKPVTVKSVAIGSINSMAFEDGGRGQLTAIVEIAGTTRADERVMFMAHVQEPSACDNASGVGLQLELALKLKEMIDSGKLERPERTITFFWGDEMRFSKFWLDAHPDQKVDVVCTIDLDMVGEDPAKTGGPMRIEKTPDPSAIYNYTVDVLPGQEPYTDEENFVRLPDSHTLWGAGSVPDVSGLYLNDLYMAATQEVIRTVDPQFQVAVCPYEGGSDHTVFLNAGIPSVLTWHFTDYVYHTTVDTLDKASAREMENVGITSLAAGYFAAIAEEYEAREMMKIVYEAAVERFAIEAENTVNHFAWAEENGKNMSDALTLEMEVLRAWGTWYLEALESCGDYFLRDGASAYYLSLEADHLAKINKLIEDAVAFASQEYIRERPAA